MLAAPTYDSVGVGATSVAMADVNGDGKPDLIVASVCASSSNDNCTNGGVSVLLGNGDGTFQAAVTYGSGGQLALSVAEGDVNGDGRPDLMVANECASINNCDGSVGVLLGNGDGTFQAAVAYGSGGYEAESVALGDVNGDGKPDVLLANYCASLTNCPNGIGPSGVSVLLGNGDGTFQAAVSYGSGGYQAASVAVGDVNGDGKPDLLLANYCASLTNCPNGIGPSGVSVLLGNGDGTFQAAVSYSSGGYNADSVAVGEVNGDNKADLLVANQCGTNNKCGSGGAGVLLGNGDGTFQAAVSYGSGGAGASLVAVGDVNGDDKPDLVVANICVTIPCLGDANGVIGLLLGNGDGTFQAAVTYGSGGDGPGASLVVGDVNGDGKADVLVANYCSSIGSCGAGSGNVGVLLGNGDGTLQAARTYGPGGYNAYSVAVADVNGDGKADLLVANLCEGYPDGYCNNGVVGVLLGNGNGTFQAAVSYGSGGFDASSVVGSDVDGDGKPDLIVANECGSGDMYCSNGTGGALGVLLGNGDGTFQTAVSYGSGGYSPSSVAVADVNGNGKPDLLVTNYCASSNCPNGIGPGGVGVLLGNGDGTFQAAVGYGSGGFGASSVAVADVNGDGKPDLLVANYCGGNDIVATCGGIGGVVSVLLGNGDGTFQVAVTYGSGSDYAGAYSVALGDVNGDGRPDLLVANYYCGSGCSNGGSVGVLLGSGDGTFQSAVSIVTPGNNSGALVLADFNGDGKLDVASGAGDALLLGNGDGTFQAPLTLGASGQGIAVGDFNRDGRPDLAVGGVTVLLNISPFSSATTITSSSNPSTFGQAVTFTATVSHKGCGTPTGTVTFYDGPTSFGTVALNLGAAKLVTSALAAGTHSLTGSYSGDTNFASSTSPVVTQIVKQRRATVTLGSSPNPSYVNQTVTFTATVGGVNGVIPTGSVIFKQGAVVLSTVPLVNGNATYSMAFGTQGTKSTTAVYSGDPNYLGKTSKVLKQVVNKYTSNTSAASSLNPSVYGQAVNLTSEVTSASPTRPTGTVTFKNGAAALGTVPLVNGFALLTKKNLPAGTLSITATYNGDTLNSKSTSPPLSQIVSQATTTTTVTSYPNPSVVGQNVAFKAAVKSPTVVPVGTVTFTAGTTTLGQVSLAGGKASLTTSALPKGPTTVTATYNGTSNITGSSGWVVQTVR